MLSPKAIETMDRHLRFMLEEMNKDDLISIIIHDMGVDDSFNLLLDLYGIPSEFGEETVMALENDNFDEFVERTL